MQLGYKYFPMKPLGLLIIWMSILPGHNSAKLNGKIKLTIPLLLFIVFMEFNKKIPLHQVLETLAVFTKVTKI